jgi:hypothetical protein
MTDNNKDKSPGWLVPITIALIGLFGTLSAALIANWDKIFDDKQTGNLPSSPPQITDKPGSSTSTPVMNKMIGSWQFSGFEFEQQTIAYWQIMPGGLSSFRIVTPNGVLENSGTWQYSDNIIFENYSNGSVFRGSVRWISNDHFELTILDNQLPHYVGMKRNYYRRAP